MKEYRLGYDYLFLADKPFCYKNELIGAMSINVLFKVFDNNGNEKLFKSEELDDQKLYSNNGKSCYLTDLIKCSIDKENIISFTPNLQLIKDFIDYTLQFEIDSYSKELDKGILEPMEISKDEFMDIMNHNFNLFDNVDNYPAQSTSYFTQELEKVNTKE